MQRVEKEHTQRTMLMHSLKTIQTYLIDKCKLHLLINIVIKGVLINSLTRVVWREHLRTFVLKYNEIFLRINYLRTDIPSFPLESFITFL